MRFSAKEFVQRPVTAKPRIERLEDRLAPADITYVGPTGGDWGVAANWSTGTVPTFSDEVIFNSQSNSCIAKNAIISSAACARLVNRGFIRSLTFQVPLTISGFLAATDADSNWSGGQLNQVNVGTSIASITLNGGEFQWTGGTWNAPPSTINDVYLTGGAQLDMYKGATNFGSNIWIGGTTNSNGTLRIGSGDSNALTGNVTMSNGADISIAAQSPEGNLSNLLFAQGATSSATVGGLATTTSQSITNYGTITRDSPSNAAVLCGLGIGQSQGGTVQLTNQSKLNITGRYGAGGNSLQQNGPSITQLGVSSLLGVTYGYYQSGGQLRTNTNPVAGSSVTATIDGWATIVGGQVSPGYDGTELLKNIATLNFTGSTGRLCTFLAPAARIKMQTSE